ncbi:tripartite tricarboxylate transporter TctB family protein [Nocardioides sp. LHG3406-4]|uniref:tripartite tricarboxylate transporter TctB family protein n=1 Tax=Nocardioides sp. LHG3406-4 TaxID=2804575 RepID=UPI003CF45BE7
MTAPDASRRAEGPTLPSWVRPKVVFLLLVLAVLAVYSEMAFELEWRTAAGRIGPGFFPRVVGGLGIVLTLVALVQTVRAPAATDETVPLEDEVGDADLGHHPVPLVLLLAACVVLASTLVALGAIVASAIFMVAVLTLLNRGHLVFNLVLGLGLPVALYVLLQTLLNSGLPEGILPRF